MEKNKINPEMICIAKTNYHRLSPRQLRKPQDTDQCESLSATHCVVSLDYSVLTTIWRPFIRKLRPKELITQVSW